MLPNKEQWCEEYLNDKFYTNLQRYTEHIIQYKKSFLPTINFNSDEVKKTNLDCTLPREIDLLAHNKFDLYSLYIVDYIRSNNTGRIYDIGCGSNMFKFFFDDVIGIDKYRPEADIFATFDESYAMKNKSKFENAIAINSIHFIPISKFKQQLEDFANCIMKGGYGYATFNINQLISRETQSNIPDNLVSYLNLEISSTKLNIVNLEMHNMIDGNDGLDGNIRILFKT